MEKDFNKLSDSQLIKAAQDGVTKELKRKIKEGKPVESGIGYNEMNHSVSLWGLDSEVDFNTAKMEEFWDFLERTENFS